MVMNRIVPRAKAAVQSKVSKSKFKNCHLIILKLKRGKKRRPYTLDKVHSTTQKMCTLRPSEYTTFEEGSKGKQKVKLLPGSGDNGARHE